MAVGKDGRCAEHCSRSAAQVDVACDGVPQRREAPLDLSLGHFGTTPVDREIDVVRFGPFCVALDYENMVAGVHGQGEASYSRVERRDGFRKATKLLQVAARSGMTVMPLTTDGKKATPARAANTSGVMINVDETNADGPDCRT